MAADATAEADADAALLYGHSYGAYHPLTYSYHAPYYRAALPYAAYTGFGHRYYANSGGAVHIVKRDADAEPEAEADALLYAGAFTSPLVYGANAHYNTYYNGAFPYRTFGYRAAYPAYTGYAAGYTGYTGFTGYRHLIGK